MIGEASYQNQHFKLPYIPHYCDFTTQGRRKVFIAGQAKLNSEHILINCVGGRYFAPVDMLFLSIVAQYNKPNK